MLRRNTITITLCLAGLVACKPPAPAQEPILTPTFTEEPLAAATAQPTTAPTETASPEPTDTETATQAPTPVVLADLDPEIPAGLLLVMGELDQDKSLWMVESPGVRRELIPAAVKATYPGDFATSADGIQILIEMQEDIWLVDVGTGNLRNVTQTPDRVEHVPRWWQNGFIFGSVPNEIAEFHFTGFLTYGDFEGTYTVLDDSKAMAAPPGAGPDGIAYNTFGEEGRIDRAWLYYLDTGRQPFDAVDFGFDDARSYGEASWSPDGSLVGWAVADENEQAAVVLFDLDQRTHHVIHRYDPANIGDFLRAPQWHADGDWLTFYGTDSGVWRYDLSTQFLALISPDISRPTFSANPTISIDGRWLATPMPDPAAGIALVDTDSWQVRIVAMPEAVWSVGWAAVP